MRNKQTNNITNNTMTTKTKKLTILQEYKQLVTACTTNIDNEDIIGHYVKLSYLNDMLSVNAVRHRHGLYWVNDCNKELTKISNKLSNVTELELKHLSTDNDIIIPSTVKVVAITESSVGNVEFHNNLDKILIKFTTIKSSNADIFISDEVGMHAPFIKLSDMYYHSSQKFDKDQFIIHCSRYKFVSVARHFGFDLLTKTDYDLSAIELSFSRFTIQHMIGHCPSLEFGDKLRTVYISTYKGYPIISRCYQYSNVLSDTPCYTSFVYYNYDTCKVEHHLALDRFYHIAQKKVTKFLYDKLVEGLRTHYSNADDIINQSIYTVHDDSSIYNGLSIVDAGYMFDAVRRQVSIEDFDWTILNDNGYHTFAVMSPCGYWYLHICDSTLHYDEHCGWLEGISWKREHTISNHSELNVEIKPISDHTKVYKRVNDKSVLVEIKSNDWMKNRAVCI